VWAISPSFKVDRISPAPGDCNHPLCPKAYCKRSVRKRSSRSRRIKRHHLAYGLEGASLNIVLLLWAEGEGYPELPDQSGKESSAHPSANTTRAENARPGSRPLSQRKVWHGRSRVRTLGNSSKITGHGPQMGLLLFDVALLGNRSRLRSVWRLVVLGQR